MVLTGFSAWGNHYSNGQGSDKVQVQSTAVCRADREACDLLRSPHSYALMNNWQLHPDSCCNLSKSGNISLYQEYSCIEMMHIDLEESV